MKVILIRPDPGNERFGLGPFFRVEPLGLEYIAAALRKRGHETTIVDARFDRNIGARLRRVGPRVVGISGMHALEYDQVIDVARAARRWAPDAFVVAGGHAAAAYAQPLEVADLDAICLDDGEEIFPALVDALASGRPAADIPGLRVRSRNGWTETAVVHDRPALDSVPAPARDLVARYRSRYHCLLFKPVWLVETARGCPFRCSFCSVWQLYGRSFRERGIGAVADDFESVGRTSSSSTISSGTIPNEAASSRGSSSAAAFEKTGSSSRAAPTSSRGIPSSWPNGAPSRAISTSSSASKPPPTPR